jgi:hypothetical protein
MKKATDLKENEVIFCSNAEENLAIRELLHEAGFKWASGDSLLNVVHFPHRCFFFCDTKRSLIRGSAYGGRHQHDAIPASEFLRPEFEAGDVVECVSDEKIEWYSANWAKIDGIKVGDRLIIRDVNNAILKFEGKNLYHDSRLFKKLPYRKGDWVYFGYAREIGWETVMQLDSFRNPGTKGINSYTRYSDGDVDFRSDDLSPLRLATPEELARIRDAYRGKQAIEASKPEDVRRFESALKFLETSGDFMQALKIAAGLKKFEK